jgi:hypothetical protein
MNDEECLTKLAGEEKGRKKLTGMDRMKEVLNYEF